MAFDDIVNRQAMLGPINLFHLGSGWKHRWAKERLRFARCFFEYVRDGGYQRGKDIGKWYQPTAEVEKAEQPSL